MHLYRISLVVVALSVVCAGAVPAADIYISAERGRNRAGEGTIESPYREIGYALGLAEPGDTLHIAEGYYPGEGYSGHWSVLVNGLKLIGGYSDDFTERDPFVRRTLLAFDDSPENTTKRVPGPELEAVKDSRSQYAAGITGIVIDGLTIDGGPRNSYLDEPGNPSLRTDKTPNDPLIFVTLEAGVGIIRNCTLLNPGVSPCVIAQARPGAKFEIYNNVFVNSVQHHLDLTCKSDNDGNRADFDVHHNTFLFAWKTSSGGSGVYCRPYTNVQVHHNILAFGDDAAVQNSFYETKKDARGVPTTGLPNENVSMDYNLLYMWQRGLYGWVLKGQSGLLYTNRLRDLEDTTLASAEGNAIGDPLFQYDQEWMTRFVNRADAAEGQVTSDLINQIREALGLPLVSTEGKNRYGYCCRYPLAEVGKFRTPGWEQEEGPEVGASMTVAEEGEEGGPAVAEG